MARVRRSAYEEGSKSETGVEGDTNCAGKRSVVPKTSCAGEQVKSSLTVVRRVSMMRGRNSVQLEGSGWARMAAFKVR